MKILLLEVIFDEEFKESIVLLFIIDKIDFIKIAKGELPLAFHFLYTNATLLTLDKFKAVIEYLDLLVIDNYTGDYEFMPNVREIHDFSWKNRI